MSHTLDVKRLDEVFDELLCNDELSKWERSFIESVKAQKDSGKKLSERQIEILEQIHIKY